MPLPFTPWVTLTPPPPLPGSEGASGSGCLAGSDPLRDGVWFGFLDRTANGIVLDLACFYWGAIAYTEGEKDGEAVANDYYIRNFVDLTWSYDVAPDVPVYSIGAGNQFLEVPFRDWPQAGGRYIPCPGERCGVWIYLNGATVTAIVEQFVP
jgi:hypothetical protein